MKLTIHHSGWVGMRAYKRSMERVMFSMPPLKSEKKRNKLTKDFPKLSLFLGSLRQLDDDNATPKVNAILNNSITKIQEQL